tara:strand:- start:1388 stop:1645 length:258 start_codon:yes stop_codon:yes gene_type:complete
LSYKCDCLSIRNKKSGHSSYGKLVTVKVTHTEGYPQCVHCGHAAVAESDYVLIPRGVVIGGYHKYASAQELKAYFARKREEYEGL